MKFRALKNRSVAVIGCGGLGNNILAHLAGCGVGTLCFCDFDRIERGNLDRQFLFREADIGQPKTARIAAFLEAYAPDLHAVPVQKKIAAADDLSFARDCDLICLAADNNAVRKAAQRFCAANGIPLLNGGVQAFFGTAYLYVPGKSPCLDCAGLLQGESGDTISVSAAVGVVGALCAEIAVRYLLKKDPVQAGILHIYDHSEIQKLQIKAAPDCGVCNKTKEMNVHG